MNGNRSNSHYYGKYRGTVINNVDPEQRGRLMLNVPDVLGPIPSSWAEPCVPLAGPTGPPMGMYHGAADRCRRVGRVRTWAIRSYPIWAGCRWGAQSDVPTLALAGNPADPNIVIQSLLQHMIMVSDMPPSPATGGIILKSTTGAMIVVNDTGHLHLEWQRRHHHDGRAKP
jgi:hypothetical protein